ncbi:MAG: alpha/beta hydrolase [Alphaproteobacteria bacterium]|nr:alpha/beta hydrolase [Alphaproteobacteria bacterium]
MGWWLLVGLALAGDGDRVRDKLTRKTERCQEALLRAEGRWSKACVALGSEASRRSQRHADRTTNRLVGKRARHVRAAERLVALDDPEAYVDVFFATNRVPDEKDFFGPVDQDGLTFGVATVYVPPGHPDGSLDNALQIAALEVLAEDDFHARLEEALGPDGTVFSYVHGYNNSFEYATRRAAQVTHDLSQPLVPVLFSWPTRGGTWFSTVKYTYDENAAARSSAPFAYVLDGLLTRHDAPIVLFAHSMGNRIASEALVDLDRGYALPRRLERAVLAAPDVDARVFERRYLDVVTSASRGVTLYCADDDRALKLSRGVHGGYDRLGSCRKGAVAGIVGALEVVDASMLYVDLVDHDKVASSPRLLRDLEKALDGVPAQARGLRSKDGRWELPP